MPSLSTEGAHRRPEVVQTGASAFAHTVGQFTPGRPDIACGVDEFVVAGTRTATDVEQGLLGSRGAVPGEQVVDVVGTLLQVGPSLKNGTHSAQVQDPRRAHVSGLAGLLLPDVGHVDLAGREAGCLEAAATSRLGLHRVDGRMVIGPATRVRHVVGAAAA